MQPVEQLPTFSTRISDDNDNDDNDMIITLLQPLRDEWLNSTIK